MDNFKAKVLKSTHQKAARLVGQWPGRHTGEVHT